MNYDHFDYSESLSEKLKGIDQYMQGVTEADPEDVNDKISKMKGRILIGVDGKDSTFDYHYSEAVNEVADYSMLIIQRTKSGNAQEIFTATKECKVYAEEIVKRMMLDFSDGINGLQDLIPESFEIHGCGPLGLTFYGVVLSFSVRTNWYYKLNQEMWK